jgi:hypothetical protein
VVVVADSYVLTVAAPTDGEAGGYTKVVAGGTAAVANSEVQWSLFFLEFILEFKILDINKLITMDTGFFLHFDCKPSLDISYH